LKWSHLIPWPVAVSVQEINFVGESAVIEAKLNGFESNAGILLDKDKSKVRKLSFESNVISRWIFGKLLNQTG